MNMTVSTNRPTRVEATSTIIRTQSITLDIPEDLIDTNVDLVEVLLVLPGGTKRVALAAHLLTANDYGRLPR